jgi:hypothetical protein
MFKTVTCGIEYHGKYLQYPEAMALDDDFNDEITPKNVSQLRKCNRISIGKSFNQLLDNLPNTITEIIFDETFYQAQFNQQINNLPINLTYLQMGKLFNQPIDFLPLSLEILILGKDFNQSVDNLPFNLYLFAIDGFGCFSQTINNLPNNIQHILLNKSYSQQIIKIPNKLCNISFGREYPHIQKFRKMFPHVKQYFYQ